ncbi:hypothetical protein [Sessilibacter corallicola]|uniref:hypothetical protein n=1 Tax=Sessilibacter corallicola TaxID=2904075 RepID=UPI001E2A47FE|nr:hypothetical protein [Sessilibacter corallicola]MCE2029910.1 hypothetical protein [Sessilibacter corallicola]
MRRLSEINETRKVFKIILFISLFSTILFSTLSVLDVYPDGYEWVDSLFLLLSGASVSFLASVMVQLYVSDEQASSLKALSLDQFDLLKELTIDVDGVDELPVEFMNLKWVAYLTSSPSEGQGNMDWRFRDITKRVEVGKKMVIYDFPSENLVKKDAKYTCTLIGFKSTVLGIISLGQEPTSVMIFDVPVPASGVYFGPSYITNWFSERALSIAVVGSGDKKPVGEYDWPEGIKEALQEWRKRLKVYLDLDL